MEISRSRFNFFGPFSIRWNFLNEPWFCLITSPQIKISSFYSYLWKLQGNLQQWQSSSSSIELWEWFGLFPFHSCVDLQSSIVCVFSAPESVSKEEGKKLQCHDDNSPQQFISPSFSPHILELSVSQHSEDRRLVVLGTGMKSDFLHAKRIKWS